MYGMRIGWDEILTTKKLQWNVMEWKIYKSTTNDIRAKYVGKCALYDILNEHLIEPIENIRITLGEIEQKVTYTLQC